MKTYEIEHVKDFLKVPADRREACLKEFADWIVVAETVTDIANSRGAKSEPARFDWIDDGNLNISVEFDVVKDPAHPEDQGRGV